MNLTLEFYNSAPGKYSLEMILCTEKDWHPKVLKAISSIFLKKRKISYKK
jgi:hypothetical protein